MKKLHFDSKNTIMSRRLKFEALESRTLLAVDPMLLSGLSGLEDVCASAPDISYVPVDTSKEEITFSSCTSEQRAQDSLLIDGNELDVEEIESSQWYTRVINVNPSAEEQELLEQINRLRTDPQGELDRIFSNYDDDTLVARNSLVNDAIKLNSYPKGSVESFLDMWSAMTAQAPLAFNTNLESAASSHSSYMKARNDVSHKCSGEDSLAVRVSKAGFESGIEADGSLAISENIGGCFSVNGDYSVASYMLAAFAVDWGVPTHEHLDAMVNAAYSEIGVSIMQTSKSIGPYVVTCDFGSSTEGVRTDGAYLLGVVYDDKDSDFFYDVGEGLGNVSVKIELQDGSGAQSVTIESWDSGGYQIFLLNGSYNVTISGDGFSSSVTKSVTISDGVNAKLDFRTDEVGSTPPVVDLNGSDGDGVDLDVVFVEGADEPTDVLADSSISIVDLDSTFLYGAKIRFDNRPDGDAETLDVSVSGTELTATFDDQLGAITISGTGTLAEYEQVISSLTYSNTSETCDLTSLRNILISVYDGIYWSEDASLNISVKPTNLPNLTVHDMEIYEGDEGAQIATFVVELDSPARLEVSFNFETQGGGSALEGLDYVISKGDPITIAPGETSAVIECYVNGNFDALKPEGLHVVEGDFENPFTFFYLKIVEVENAFLTNEDSLAKGVIYDDDSPIVVGTTNEYSLANALSTDAGNRRYVFTVTPETSGFFSWNAEALGAPAGTTITVHENSLESEVIAVSTVGMDGGRAQWFADPSVEYWIVVESTSDLAHIHAKLLEISEENVVLVDPLLENSAESLVELMWADDSLEMSVGDLTWSFDSNFWNEVSLKTELPEVEFMTDLRPQSVNSFLESDDDFSLVMGDLSLSISGFASYVTTGSDENEELTLYGTPGYDYLYYSGGSGFFQTSEGRTYTFNGVNKLTIDGLGGDDFAYFVDSMENDQLVTDNNSITMNGGGFTATAFNFSKSFVVFNMGGEDEYIAEDSGDDVKVVLASGSSITTGTYDMTFSDELEDEVSAPYTRTVIGVEKSVLAPTSTIGSVLLNDNGSVGVRLNATVGSLETYDQSSARTTLINRAKSLAISGVHPFVADDFILSLPEEYSYSVDGDQVVVVDSVSGWELTVPSWKFVATSGSSLDLLPLELFSNSLPCRDKNFEENLSLSDADSIDSLDVDDDVFTNLAENVLAESRWVNKQHGISGFRQNRQDDEDSILDFIWDDPLEYEIYTKKGNLFC